MNIFILGWNTSKDSFPVMLDAIHKITAIYPELDSQTAWHFSLENKVFVASIHTANDLILPRCYVFQNANNIVFYSGCLFNITGKFNAHIAREIANNWEDIPESLEGHFAIIKITKYPLCVELVNDFLGIEQIYYLQFQNACLVSNSVELISKITGINNLDPLGVSLFLVAGWVGSNHTLRQNIRVLPAAQHWIWTYTNSEPRKVTYLQSCKLAHQVSRQVTEPNVPLLAERILSMLQTLFNSFGELGCPLSGGRDSRVLAALLIRNNIPAKYFTNGEQFSSDVQIAIQIAKAFNLSHQVNIKTAKDTTQNWKSSFLNFIKQNDGMLSLRMINLWHIVDEKNQITQSKRKIFLSGIGGEIGRGFYSDMNLFRHISSLEDVTQYLTSKVLKYSGELISKDIVKISQEYLKEFILQAIDEGFSLIDIPDIFYIKERLRRWAGISLGKSMLYNDHLSLFCTRPFVEAAFSITTISRYCEVLHYELIQQLMPKLNQIPFDTPWQDELCSLKNINQNVFYQTDHKNISAFDKSVWLEKHRHLLLELCLEQSSSLLWSYISCSKFEHIMSDATTPKKRRKYVKLLFSIFTLFYYELT